jgi:hypothetical protein
MSRARLTLLLVLAGLGIGLLVTAVPGVFIIDEDSYIATVAGLRRGVLHVPGTEGLPPSPEVLAFDASPRSRPIASTPVVSSSPPLYAPLALPFSYFGIRGLIALQVLSFVACAWLVFACAARIGSRPATPWLALATFVLASATVEYAQAVWPHMLTAALAMAAVEATSRVRGGAPLWLAPLAGVAAGLAAGVRYQNLVLAVAIGVTLLWSERSRRWRALVGFALGLALPLAASGAINHARIGSWNPVSKGPSYLDLGTPRTASQLVTETLAAAYARVIDYREWPPHAPGRSEESTFIVKNPTTRAFLLGTAVKKAWLQSAPWLILPLLGLVVAWLRRAAFAPATTRELRAFSLLVVAVVGMFAVFGFRRHDGWCFNQRYLLELMPILAVSWPLLLEDRSPRLAALLSGAGLAIILLVPVAGLDPRDTARQDILLQAPLAIAAALAAVWLLWRAGRASGGLLGVCLGAALGWALAVHAFDDLRSSRALRGVHASQLDALSRLIPKEERAALFTFWGNKDAFGPMTLDRDFVIADVWIDRGASARVLSEALLGQGRSVYLLSRGMSSDTIKSLVKDRKVEPVPQVPYVVVLRP